MAWTTPKTDWKTAYLVTAADLNLYLRDNLNCLGGDHSKAASTWLPALSITSGTTAPDLGGAPTQSGTFTQFGKVVQGSCLIRFSSDSAAGTGIYTVSLPAGMSSDDPARDAFGVVGTGAIYDASGADTHRVVLIPHTSAVGKMRYTSTGSTATWVTGAAPFAWSSNDTISLHLFYGVA